MGCALEPFCTQHQGALIETERKATTWIHHNLLKLHKMFGVDFQGMEEEALELLKLLDASRQVRKMERSTDVNRTKHKGAQELKNLISFDAKFKSNGYRGKGKGSSENTP